MTLQQMRYFSTLAKVLHYTKAAAELCISQPSLSYSISEMEKEMEVSLFEKKDGKIILTRYGELLLPFVEEALKTIEDGILKIKREKSPSTGTVRLGYFYSISSSFIPNLIDKFCNSNKDLNINFTFHQDLNSNLVSELRAGKLDIAFCCEKTEGLESKAVMEQELFLIVSSKHKFSNDNEISIHDFATEPLIMLHKDSGLRKLTEQIYSQYGYTPYMVFEAAECNAAMQFVSLGRGIAIIPKIPAIVPSIKVIKIREAEFKRTIYVTWNKATILPPGKTTLEHILNNFSSFFEEQEL